MQVLHIHHDPRPSARILVLRRFLQNFDLNVSTYSWQNFNANNIVYLRLSLDRHPFYIGKSKHTITDRELARNRQFSQLVRGVLANYELALRWWHQNGS